MPPPPRELAVAALVAGAVLALGNAIDIALSVPSPGLALRLQHHLVDVVICLGAGAWVALAILLASMLRRPRALRWLVLVMMAIGAMAFVLGRELLRQANVPFESEHRQLLLVIYVTLSGLALPAAYAAGAFAARIGPKTTAAAILIGLAGVVTGHLILRDDYPGVHTAILWVASSLVGAASAPAWSRRLRADRPLALVAAWLAIAALVPPANDIRCELGRQPGAVVPWLLGRLWWSPPPVDVVAASPEIAAEIGSEQARQGLPRAPVVVLLTVDALRADLIASGRYDDKLPTFAQLRDSSVFFPHAIAPGSQTSVSLTSVFSGRYYSQLRWAYFGKGRSRFHYAADDPAPRFPELLTASGVSTTSFLPIGFLKGELGIARGFADETVVSDGRGHAPADAVMVPLIERLRAEPEGPAFFYAHLTEPHEPYDRGGIEGTAFERYLAEVALVDAWLLRLLGARGRARKATYLIVTADHGEGFGEHGRFFHTKSLYEEMVAVPLILSGPGLRRRRIDTAVSLIDLGPTVLDLFGLPPPPGTMGRSLLPLARGVVEPLPSPVFAEGRLQRAYWRGDGLKVIEDTERKTVEVYDLAADPNERRNLFGREARADLAVAELRAFFAAHALEGYDPPFKP